jgi:hypothetical protein
LVTADAGVADSPSENNMQGLPHLDRAVVLETKIVSYLLSTHHPGGRAKARFLKSFAFRAEDWHTLREAIIAHAKANDIIASHQTRFGTRYEIDGPLPAPDGRAQRYVWYGSWTRGKMSRAW